MDLETSQQIQKNRQKIRKMYSIYCDLSRLHHLTGVLCCSYVGY
jgi:hypothetical protein